MGCQSTTLRQRIQRSFSIESTYDCIPPVFGVPLVNVVRSEKMPSVAKIVVDCIEFIESNENMKKDIYSESRPTSDYKSIAKLKQKVIVRCKCVYRHLY